MPTSSSLLIKDLNLIYKPRERLIKLGANNLTSQELLAIL
jgi:DNA repair protein RadC